MLELFSELGNYSSYYIKPAHGGLLAGNDTSSAEQFEGEKRKIANEKKDNEKAFNEIWYVW